MTNKLDNITGIPGELRILRECKKCGHERLFNRIGMTHDKIFWYYTCERCDNEIYLSTTPQQRLREVRLRT